MPNAPDGSASSEPTDDNVSNPQANSSISGTVLDPNGGALPGARVTLADADGGGQRVVLADNDGKFAFGDLAAGTFKVTITSAAMGTFVRPDIVLGVDDRRELPPIVLAIAGVTTEVHVVVTQTELAQEQVKAAEQQRVLGVLPNFYSSYIWDAAPLNSRQKFNLAFHSITDPVEFLGTGVVAGAEQATNTFSGYGQGAQGYAKRYGAAYADDVLGRMIGSAFFRRCSIRTQDTSIKDQAACVRAFFTPSQERSSQEETTGTCSPTTPMCSGALLRVVSRIFIILPGTAVYRSL